MLRTPTITLDADVVGWRDNRLVFPAYSLRPVSDDTIRPDGVELVGPDTPGRTIELPGPLTRPQLRPVSITTPQTAAFWAVISIFVHNLICRGLFRPKPIGLAIGGVGALELAHGIRDVFDCRQIELPKGLACDVSYKRLEAACAYHDLPAVVLPRQDRMNSSLDRWLSAAAPRNCVIPLNWHAAQVAAINGWPLIEIDDPSGLMGLLRSLGRQVLTGYLEDLCRRRLGIHHTGAGFLDSIVNDIADWSGRVGRARIAVLDARSMLGLRDARPTWQRFVELLQSFQRDGELRMAKDDHAWFPRSATRRLVRTAAQAGFPAAVWIPKRRFDRLLVRRGAPHPSSSIDDAFSRAGVWTGEHEVWPEVWLGIEQRWFDRWMSFPSDCGQLNWRI
jgi:hypothetical protein